MAQILKRKINSIENMTANLVRWQSAEITHQGNVRDYNEDACLIAEQPFLWVVADGMGGHEAGDIASQSIMDELQTITPTFFLNELVNQIDDKLITVNEKLRNLGKAQYNNRTIGSTVIAMSAYHDHIAYLWAGDSRLYRIRNQQITQLSKDHSEVQNLIDQGLLSPEDAENHPAANVINRAIGASENLYLSIGIEKVQHEDIYLLCSDGLYRDISDLEILQLVAQKDVNQITTDLMTLALSREAKDNITIVIAKCSLTDERE